MSAEGQIAAAAPTVGRIVHYFDNEHHLAALVVHVHDHAEGVVNLAVFNPQGLPFPVEKVPYSADPVAGSWHWPER